MVSAALSSDLSSGQSRNSQRSVGGKIEISEEESEEGRKEDNGNACQGILIQF